MNVGNEMCVLEAILLWICAMPVVVVGLILIISSIAWVVVGIIRTWYVQRALKRGAICTRVNGTIKIRYTK